LHGKKSGLLIYCQSNLFLLVVYLRKTHFTVWFYKFKGIFTKSLKYMAALCGPKK